MNEFMKISSKTLFLNTSCLRVFVAMNYSGEKSFTEVFAK